MPDPITYGWYTAEALKLAWKDAASIPAGTLQQLLDTAREQCSALPPLLSAGESIQSPQPEDTHFPARIQQAHLLQVRALWNATMTGPVGDQIGPDGYTVRVYPMDWQVKALLRPAAAMPGIG